MTSNLPTGSETGDESATIPIRHTDRLVKTLFEELTETQDRISEFFHRNVVVSIGDIEQL